MIEIPAPLKKSAACVEAARAARKQCIEQQKLVLRYPDIAKRLCEPPLGYAAPGQWTGYIPPAYDAEQVDGSVPLNTSRYRAVLMEILEAAAERADSERRAA
jgi:hypothetical protein